MCVCVHVHVYIHVCVCLCLCLYLCVYVSVCVYLCVWIYNKTVDVDSPWRQENVKRVMRGSYISLTSSVVQSAQTADQVVLQLCRKIKEEIKLITSNEHNSILRDNHEGVKNFSWENIWKEVVTNIPTLVKIITSLIFIIPS